MKTIGKGFRTVKGRGLLGEFRHFAHQPALVVTMEDLWPRFGRHFPVDGSIPYFVKTLDAVELEKELPRIPRSECVIGLGGGQAVDVAKWIAWKRRLPLFQAPTSTSVDACFGQRTAIRFDGTVRYVGWAVPEAVYVDYDVIRAAPPALNRSGVGDVFCMHTAYADWKLARDRGRTEERWPYDEELAEEAYGVFEAVLAASDEIGKVSERGIDALVEGLRYTGSSFHEAGWCPRHVEGFDHFLFYALERMTGRKFLHGQPVCLGIYAGSLLHAFKAEEMLEAMRRVGVDIRPESMGLSWLEVERALEYLPAFVKEAGLFYTIASEFAPSPAFVKRLREGIEAIYGAWDGTSLGVG